MKQYLRIILSLCIMLLVCATSLAQYHHHDDRGSVCFGLDDKHSHSACNDLTICHIHSRSHSSTCTQHLLSFFDLPRTDDDNFTDSVVSVFAAPSNPLTIAGPAETQLLVASRFIVSVQAYCDNILSASPTRGSPPTSIL